MIDKSSEEFSLYKYEKGKYINLNEYPTILPVNIPTKFMKYYKFYPIRKEENKLYVSMANPLDFYVKDAIKLFTGLDVEPLLGDENDILKAINMLSSIKNTSMEKIIENIEEDNSIIYSEDDQDIDHLKDLASEAPIIRLVNLIITRAVDERASDIHIEPFDRDLFVRYRIDGILHNVESLPKRLQSAIISRIKIMANLNIAERRLPQDGRIRLKVSGKDIDLRISTIPTLYGESVVMRILDRASLKISLEQLGFHPESLKIYEHVLKVPHGIILVTGPTGSGKTTTLYASLEKLNSPDKKIITIEDPVEYQLEGVNQIQVKPKIGLTFANGLRHIVRQDPDILMVGEIRDPETAEISIQSALTGHLVFSTLHTNDAAGSITRLLDMGVENYLISSSIISILAQRLIRKICDSCKEWVNIDPKILKEVNIHVDKVYRGRGCKSCRNTG
jgi:general secretion pathway protein E